MNKKHLSSCVLLTFLFSVGCGESAFDPLTSDLSGEYVHDYANSSKFESDVESKRQEIERNRIIWDGSEEKDLYGAVPQSYYNLKANGNGENKVYFKKGTALTDAIKAHLVANQVYLRPFVISGNEYQSTVGYGTCVINERNVMDGVSCTTPGGSDFTNTLDVEGDSSDSVVIRLTAGDTYTYRYIRAPKEPKS